MPAGHAVPGVQRRDLVGFCERRIVEGVLDEIVERSAKVQHGLANMDQLRRAFADNVASQQSLRLLREDHLHEAGIQPHDLPPRRLAESRNATLIRDLLLADLFLGHPDRRHFRHRIDAIWKEFRRRLRRRIEGVAGRDAALFH